MPGGTSDHTITGCETISVTMKKIALALGLAGGCVAALVLYFFDPVRVPIYPVCQFHRLTGLDCPGCGSLRAMHALLHGQIDAALHFNLLLVLSMPLFAGLAGRYFWRQKKGLPGLAIPTSWLWIYLAAWVVFGVVRNMPIHAFAAFAP